MNTEENKAVEELEMVTAHAEKYGWGGINLKVEDARHVLNVIAELRKSVNERPDTESELAPGDDVQTLIDYRVHERGKEGFVDRVVDTDEYPVKVLFKNEEYPVGYKRHELGKL